MTASFVVLRAEVAKGIARELRGQLAEGVNVTVGVDRVREWVLALDPESAR